MQLTKGAIGNLINRYKAVLKKCHLMNTFGSLAVAGMLVMGGAGVAGAANYTAANKEEFNTVFEKALQEESASIKVTSPITNGSGIGIFNSAHDTQIKKLTIDFGGNTYTFMTNPVGSPGTKTQAVHLEKDRTVTLKNGTLDVAQGSNVFKRGIQNYCDLTLDNMVVDGTNLLGDGTYTMSNNYGDITINNSTIIAKKGGVAFDVYYGMSDSYKEGVSVTVNNSIITGKIEVTVADNATLAAGAKHQLTLTGGTLTGGLTAEQGAQLYNEGTTVISNVAMAKNTAIDKGGAIFNSDDKMGAEGDLILNNVDLKDNKANFGGAIWNEGTLTVNGGSFESNKADKAAGAIYNAADAKLTVDGVTFANNSSAKAGAINNYNGTVAISDSTFKGNAAGTSMGGAVTNTSGSEPGKSIITITGSTFEGNKAGNGGAVWNGTYGKVTITDSTFKGNTALAEGGLGQGGAITNAGQMTIKGTNTFSGNTAAKGKDIYNSGTLIMTRDSHLIVDGNQNIYNADRAKLTVENGARLTIADAVSGGTYTVVSGEGNISFTGGGYNAADSTGWKGENLQASSDMVILTSTDGKTFTAEGRDAHDVFTGLDDGLADAVNSLYARHGAAGTNGWNYADVDAEERGIRFLSRATDKRFIGADHQAAAATIESAARIAFAGAVPQMTKMASDAGTNAVVNRLGFANPADGAQAMDAEGKIVDRNTTGFALWIAPLWQSQHGWGMDADSMDYGFNGNLGGVSLGADYTFENAIRAGITFNIGGGYAESSGGDLSSTDNRMNFWGLGAYAGWNYENFGVMADVSYTSTWNDLKQDVDSRMGMGDLEADVQATAISAGLRAEYLLQTSAMDIIPHIGVRYMSLNTWGYDVDTHGGTVLEGDSLHQDIWTFPIGVTFSKDFALDSGWNFKPSLDFTVIPAAGDIKAKHDVHFTGLPGTYEVETQMMDYLTWQGGVGLEMGNDTMSFGVNYTLQAGQHTTGHGVFGSFRYEF